MTIIENELEQYKTTLSIERLKSFMQNENDTIDVLLERYVNNIKISQALYPELSILEVTLRNAINTTLCKYISDTWIEDEIQHQKILLENYDRNTLIKTYNDIKRDCMPDMFTVGKVIANLNFGFWTNLCSKKYNSVIWTRKGCFKEVFANFPKGKQQQIHVIANKLNSIRKLRNRVFHYEPVLKNPEVLLNKYNEIMEILSYLPHDNAQILKRTTSFLNVYNEVLKSVNKAKT